MKDMNEYMKNRIWKSHAGLTKLSWNEIYDSEQELIDDLMKVNASTAQPSYKIPMGYVYIDGFQNRISKGLPLTDKQMLQLKRLASSIAFNLYIQNK